MEPVILFRRFTLKRKALLTLATTSLLTLVLGGGIAHYLISINTYSEMEKRMRRASDSLHMAIQMSLKQNVNGYLRGISDTYLELIKLLDEDMGEAGKAKARQLMLRQKVGDSGYMVALNCSKLKPQSVAVHPNPALEGLGVDYFPFLSEECATQSGLFEFVLNAPGINNKPKSIWLNTYEPWGWTFGPAPFSDSHSEIIQLAEIRPFLELLSAQLQHPVFILALDGQMLYHPDYQGQDVSQFADAITGRLFVREALDKIGQQIREHRPGIVGGADFHLENPHTQKIEKYLAHYRYMPETEWIIGVQVKSQEIGMPTQQLAIALLLSFVVSALFMTWLLDRLSRPFFDDVNELNQAVKRIGEGYFDIEILSAREDELGDLSAAFAQMAKNLAALDDKQTRYRMELEEKVRERTQKLRDQNAKLERLTMTDCLTCVGNRRHFDQVLYEEIMRANRTHTELCLMLLDVDYFKAYNDEYGHPAGDEVLRRVAYVMTQCAQRSIDLVARYGGEEFTLVALDTPLSGAKNIAGQIQLLLDEQNIEHQGSPFGRVTVSIGICVMSPDAGFSAEALIEAADAALYKAKESGRNRIEAMSV